MAQAQQPAMPVIGLLNPQSPEAYVEPMRAHDDDGNRCGLRFGRKRERYEGLFKLGANNRAPVSNYLISIGFDFDGVKVRSGGAMY